MTWELFASFDRAFGSLLMPFGFACVSVPRSSSLWPFSSPLEGFSDPVSTGAFALDGAGAERIALKLMRLPLDVGLVMFVVAGDGTSPSVVVVVVEFDGAATADVEGEEGVGILCDGTARAGKSLTVGIRCAG